MMDGNSVDQVLAEATSALQRDHDVTGFLVDLIAACQPVLAVDATGIMVLTQSKRLHLLAASTHRSAELELYQSQIDEGPCVDAAERTRAVTVADPETLTRRWPRFGPAMLDAGFRSVHSLPLLWEGTTMGAMAHFRRAPIAFDGHGNHAAEAFAEVVAYAVMDDGQPDDVRVDRRVEVALAGRMVVEQAKGVLAAALGVGMAEAYEALIDRTRTTGVSLTATARQVIEQAERRGRVQP